jgi:predicted metal-dependent phosphoesterase TrpH
VASEALAAPSDSALTRHPHLGSAIPAGRVRVDMHVHCHHSGDSTTTIEELHSAVIESGIDVVCLTDHHSIKGAEILARELTALGHRVICGEEVRTHSGEIIGLFLSERIPFGLTALETAQKIRDQGGLVYVPHPFDPLRRNLAESSLRDLAEAGMIDAIEVINSKTSLSSLNAKALEFAREFGIAEGAGSDAHVPLAVGAACVEMDDFTNAAEFLRSLHMASAMGHHWDEPRPWSARIVPAT